MKQLLLLFTLVSPCVAWAQGEGKIFPETAPTLVKAKFFKPQIERLEVEDRGRGHYEKWREKTLVVFANLSAQEQPEKFVTEILKHQQFHLLLQSDASTKDFNKRIGELKKELKSIDSDPPKLNKWNRSVCLSTGEGFFPKQEWNAHPKLGYTCHAWFYRVYEIESTKEGKKNLFKGTLNVYADGPYVNFPQGEQVLNIKTGELTSLRLMAESPPKKK